MTGGTAGLNRVKARMNSRRFRVSELQTQRLRSPRKSDRHDPYHDGVADESAKDRHRHLAVRHFSRYAGTTVVAGRERRCFSLPGKKWVFERLLSSHRKMAWRFRACERRFATIEYSMGYMPHKRLGSGWTTIGEFDVATTDRSIIAHASVMEVMAAINRSSKVSRHVGQWDSFWWDFQGPLLSPDMARLCHLLPRCLYKQRDVIPFAITFLIGRETIPWGRAKGVDGLNSRINAFVQELKKNGWRIRVPHKEQYRSNNGTPMGFFLGTIYREQ